LDASVMAKFAGGSIDKRALTTLSIFQPEPYVPYSFSNSSLRRILAVNKDMVFCIRTIALWRNIRGVSSASHVERIQPRLNSIQVLTKFVVVNALGQSLQTRLEGGRRDDATTWQGQLILFPKGAGVVGLSDTLSPIRGSSGHPPGSFSPQGFRDRKVVHITASMSEGL
jgi:hypothetical protein